VSTSVFDGLLFGTELLFIPLALAAYIVFTADTVRRLIAMQVSGVIGAVMFGLLAIVFATEAFAELAIALGLLSIGGGIAYAYFLERWL
jgi:multisubunit Na+/H+ antiporter MnhF subunit